MGIADKVPPNLKFAVLGLTVPVLTLYVLALVGCVSISPGIPSLYLFLLQVNEVTLRVGYFAVCAVDAANITNVPISSNGTANGTAVAEDGTICVPTLGFNATDLSVKLFGDNEDVIPILDLALTLQRNILVPLILVASFVMIFGAIFFALAKVTQMKLKDPNTFAPAMKQLGIFKPATLAMLWISVMFAFAAAVASTMAVGALNFIIPVLATNISVTGGKIVQAIQYLSFIFNALFALGATIMLGDKLEQQEGMMGSEEDPSGGEKGLEDMDSYDESMMQQQQQEQPGMEGQEQPYPEGAEYGQEGQEQQYPEGQEYEQQQQQQYEGQEYAQPDYGQQQEMDPQQLQYQQQQQQQQQPYPG